jgi:hypothetical protein
MKVLEDMNNKRKMEGYNILEPYKWEAEQKLKRELAEVAARQEEEMKRQAEEMQILREEELKKKEEEARELERITKLKEEEVR